MPYHGFYYEHIAREIEESDTILDVACGIAKLASFVKLSNYVGVDFTPEFLTVARKEHPGIVVWEGNALSLAFIDNNFDVTVARAILEHLAPKSVPVAISELIRVAKKRVIISFFKRPRFGSARIKITKNKGGWFSNRLRGESVMELIKSNPKVKDCTIKNHHLQSSVWIIDLVED